jgi:hypothetical protein
VSTPNENHEATCDEVYKSGKFLHLDGTIKHCYAKRRMESFPTKGKVCCPTFGSKLNNLA